LFTIKIERDKPRANFASALAGAQAATDQSLRAIL